VNNRSRGATNALAITILASQPDDLSLVKGERKLSYVFCGMSAYTTHTHNQTQRQTGRQTFTQTHTSHTHTYTDTSHTHIHHTATHTYTHTYTHTHTQTDTHRDRQKDRETDIHTDTYITQLHTYAHTRTMIHTHTYTCHTYSSRDTHTTHTVTIKIVLLISLKTGSEGPSPWSAVSLDIAPHLTSHNGSLCVCAALV